MVEAHLRVQGRPLVRIGCDVDVPLIGAIAFGLIDRGTNVIQVRPISLCVLNCIFCSTDAGPKSRYRQAEYIIDLDLLVEWFKEIAKFKGDGIEAHIDTVGDPLLYNKIVDLVHELKNIREVKVVSMQSHAPTLTEKLADKLDAAGLDRLNLSIDSLDPNLAKYLQGTEWYNAKRVMEVAEYIVKNTRIDLLLAPILLPGLNDHEIPKIIEWGLKIGVGKKWPPFGIQKFIRHKYGRKPKGVRDMSWREFYNYLRQLEKKYNVKLVCTPRDFGIHYKPIIPYRFKVNERVRVKTIAPGWLKGEVLAIPLGRVCDRVITVVNASNIPLESKITVRIIANKHNIYLAEPIA
ncbi:MAG TPA: radical SAM protein [Desulfurococcales archaeon]|nr:radical SAM protein [Desulfurococcales archaeon]